MPESQDSAIDGSISQAAWCAVYAAGIIGSLTIYGLCQERIMAVSYDGEFFRDSVFLVLCNRVTAMVVALVMASLQNESLALRAPIWKYGLVSLSNTIATTCQYESLKHVSFAVQMLGKSFKMMPVMLWGVVISGKSYGARDWLVAAAVTAGVTEFLLTGPTKSTSAAGSTVHGILLLLVYLAFDGLTSTMQEKLFKEHATPRHNQMLFVNLSSSIMSVVTLLASRTLLPALHFSTAHPRFMFDASLLSASAVGGQFFILSQVQEFGALVFAATMNIRQVLSILMSYITYRHSITLHQVFGLVLVFAALFHKSLIGCLDTKRAEKQPLVEKKEGSKQSADSRLPESA